MLKSVHFPLLFFSVPRRLRESYYHCNITPCKISRRPEYENVSEKAIIISPSPLIIFLIRFYPLVRRLKDWLNQVQALSVQP